MTTSTTREQALAARMDALEERCRILQAQVEFFYYWFVRSDERQRHLAARAGGLDDPSARNDAAFTFKWEALGQGYSSIEDEKHRAAILETLRKWTGFEPEWFRGKPVLDAGCGDGRLSYGACLAGASVTSIDKLENAVARTKEHCARFANHRAFTHDLLEPLDLLLHDSFELVMAIGVVHHTGDTQKAIRNLVCAVRPGGRLALMVYGYPRLERPADFSYLCRKERLRQSIRHLSFEEAKAFLTAEIGDELAVRGWFDATTPEIEDFYLYPQVAKMLRDAGLTDIERLDIEMRNISVRGRKPLAST